MLDVGQTVGNIVLDHSECASVLQRNRIDFCCRGHMSLKDACEAQGLDPQQVAKELESAIANRSGVPQSDPRDMSTPALVAHLIDKHHRYLRNVLPFVKPLAAKVARVHGDKNEALVEINEVVNQLEAALLPHLDDEERALFPTMMTGAKTSPLLAESLRSMQAEHLQVGDLLHRLRKLTDDFQAPSWACNSYRTLFGELAALETDTLQHVHLENHVLAPRFAQ